MKKSRIAALSIKSEKFALEEQKNSKLLIDIIKMVYNTDVEEFKKKLNFKLCLSPRDGKLIGKE